MPISDELIDMLLHAYLHRDELCQYMVHSCMVVDTSAHKDVKIPTSHKNALRSVHRDQWIHAEQSEIASLESKGVFKPMVLPPGKSLIDTKWVYTLK